MSRPITVHYDRVEPVTVRDVDELDSLLDRLAADPRFQRFPVMASLGSADNEHILEIMIGHRDLSLLVWHEMFVDVFASRSTVDQPPDLAYNYGGSRTTAYDRSAVPVDVARQAAREFMATGARPTCVEWDEPKIEG